MANWTDLSGAFAYGSKLTSAQMQQLRDNVTAAFEQASGKTIPLRYAPRRAGDLASCWSDVTRAGELLNWKAERSLDEMCADSWKYIQHRK